MFKSAKLLAIAVLVAACGTGTGVSSTVTTGAAGNEPVAAAAAGTERANGEEVTATSAAERSEAPSGAAAVTGDVVDFVAALGDTLAGTAYAESVVADPEVFVATGALFCERLAAGEMPDDLLTGYVEVLTGDELDRADEDSLTLAGSTLGTAVGFLCPEHTAVVEERL